MNYLGLLFIGIGLFAAVAAAFDWDWYMNSRKARWMVNLIGRNGARLLYIVLGGALVVAGSLELFGMIELSRRH